MLGSTPAPAVRLLGVYMFRHFVFSFIAVIVFAALSTTVHAAETIETYSGVTPFNLDEYSRTGTKAAITFTNSEGGNATATVQCGNPGGGMWQAIAVGGVCYNKDYCFDVATSAVADVKATVLAGKTITSETVKPGTEGKVTNICYNVTKEATLDDVTTTDYSKCTGGAIKSLKGLDGSDVKKHCIFNYTGPADGIVGVDPDASKNDDMFRIKSSVAAFLEYVDRSTHLDNNRLRWITRSSGSGEVMLPSGPHAGSSKYKDYDIFMLRAPGGVHTEDACYPTTITMCAGSAPPPSAPPSPGVCGAADGQSYTDISDIAAGDRCYIGTPTTITEADGKFNWSCKGIPESQPADNCTASKKDDSLVVDPDRPPEEVTPPSEFCFFHVTGLLLSNTYLENWYTIIGQVDKYSQLVGPGEYPKAEPFARASATTFDGIALGKDTRVTIYSGPNFTGNVLFDGHGPMVMNNIHYREYEPKIEQNGGKMDTWLTETWPGDFNKQFPPSTRRWSEVGCNDPANPKCMWNWGGATPEFQANGGKSTSLKVTCDTIPGECGSAQKTVMLDSAGADLCKSGDLSSFKNANPNATPAEAYDRYNWTWKCGQKAACHAYAGVGPICVDNLNPKIDVVFVVDGNWYEDSPIESVKSQMSAFFDAMKAQKVNGSAVDLHIGVASFSGSDALNHKVISQPVDSYNDIKSALAPWKQESNQVYPSTAMSALYNIGKGNGDKINWRSGAQRIMIWVGGATSMEDQFTRTQAAGALKQAGIHVLAIGIDNASGSTTGLQREAQINGDPNNKVPEGQAEAIANGTGGYSIETSTGIEFIPSAFSHIVSRKCP